MRTNLKHAYYKVSKVWGADTDWACIRIQPNFVPLLRLPLHLLVKKLKKRYLDFYFNRPYPKLIVKYKKDQINFHVITRWGQEPSSCEISIKRTTHEQITSIYP